MKFRTIFIVFNAVVAFSFVFLFISPLAVLGPGAAAAFWAKNWLLAVFFIAILASLNFFFASNNRLFSLLEREDWTALVSYLDGQIYGKGRLTARNARIQVNALLLLSDLGAIERLEKHLADKKPALLERIALPFALSRLLSGNDAEAEPFLSRYASSRRAEGRDWISFDLGFCLTRRNEDAKAAAAFSGLLSSRIPAVRGLSAWFLSMNASKDKGLEGQKRAALAEATRTSLASRFRKGRWERECADAKSDIQGVVFSRYLSDATDWLYGDGSAGTAAKGAS